MAVANEQYDEFREQLLHESTRPSLCQVRTAKVRVRQYKLLRVVQHRSMNMHDAFEVITQRKRRRPVYLWYISIDSLCSAAKVVVKVGGDDPNCGGTPKEANDSLVKMVRT